MRNLLFCILLLFPVISLAYPVMAEKSERKAEVQVVPKIPLGGVRGTDTCGSIPGCLKLNLHLNENIPVRFYWYRYLAHKQLVPIDGQKAYPGKQKTLLTIPLTYKDWQVHEVKLWVTAGELNEGVPCNLEESLVNVIPTSGKYELKELNLYVYKDALGLYCKMFLPKPPEGMEHSEQQEELEENIYKAEFESRFN